MKKRAKKPAPKRVRTVKPKPTLAAEAARRMATLMVANQTGPSPSNDFGEEYGAGGLCENVKANGIHDGPHPCGADLCKCAGIAENILSTLEEAGALTLAKKHGASV